MSMATHPDGIIFPFSSFTPPSIVESPQKVPHHPQDPSGPTTDVISMVKQQNLAARRADVPPRVITNTSAHDHIPSKMLSRVNSWEDESQCFQRSGWLEKRHGLVVLRRNIAAFSNHILKTGLKGTESINDFNPLLREKIKSIQDTSDVCQPHLGLEAYGRDLPRPSAPAPVCPQN